MSNTTTQPPSSSRAKDHAIVQGAHKPIGVIRSILLAIALGLLVLAGSMSIREYMKDRPSRTASKTPATATVVQRVGKVNQLYRFAEFPDGCVSLNLESDFDDYPKGGRIKIHFPDGKVETDEPGTDHNWGKIPRGLYKFCPDDPNTWGVEIWN